MGNATEIVFCYHCSLEIMDGDVSHEIDESRIICDYCYNDDEHDPDAIICDNCDKKVKKGGVYYDIDGDQICEDCMSALMCFA